MNKKSLWKNALYNGIKQLASIVFPFISFYYCSRVLGANGIGAYSYGQSYVSYFLLLSSLGIPLYAIREGAQKKSNIHDLSVFVNEVFSLNVIMTFVSYIFLFVLILFVKKLEKYTILLLIQSLQIMLSLIGADWINSIFEDFLFLAKRYIAIQVISIVFLFVFVKDENDIINYALITVFSNSGGNLCNLVYLRRKYIYPHLLFHPNLKKHLKPIIVLFCNNLAGVVYLNSDITVLGILTSDRQVGIYTVASKMYSLIKSLINSIIMVTIPRFSEYLANDNIEEYQNSLSQILNLLLILVTPIICIMTMEPLKILQVIAGEGYESGKAALIILSITMFFAVGSCFFSYSCLIPQKKESIFLKATVIAAIINLVLNVLLIPTGGGNAAAFTTLIAELLIFLIVGTNSFKLVNIQLDTKNVVLCIFSGCACLVSCMLFDAIINNIYINLLCDILLSEMLSFMIHFIFKNNSLLSIMKMFRS